MKIPNNHIRIIYCEKHKERNCFDCAFKVSCFQQNKSNALQKENAELKAKITEVIPVIQTIYNEDYGSRISDDLFNVLQVLESSEVKK